MNKFEKIFALILTLTIICSVFSPLIALAAETVNTVEFNVEKGKAYTETVFTVSAKATKLSGQLSNIKGSSRLLGVVNDLKVTISSDTTGQHFCLEFTARRSGTAELDYECNYTLNGKSTTDKRHIVITVTNEKMEKMKSTVSGTLSGITDKAADITEKATDKATDIAGKAGDKATEYAGKAADKTVEIAGKAADKATDLAGKAADTATEYAGKAGEAAKETAQRAGELAENAKDSVVSWYESLDLSAFESGWDYFQKISGAAFSTGMTAVSSQQYIQKIQKAIDDFATEMNKSKGSRATIPSQAGFAAERWHALTFNIDAAVNQSPYNAKTLDSHELGSTDVAMYLDDTIVEEAQLKYYKNGEGSAKAQAEAIVKAYTNYVHQAEKNGTENIKTLEEYMNEHGYDPSSQSDLLRSIYSGQTRIIPSDQLAEAKDFLNGRIKKLSKKDGDVAAARTDAYQETLTHLRDRLNAPDGSQSKPVTYEEMQTIAELCQDGEFKPEDFGVTVSQLIPAKYVLKQSINAGLQSGAISAVLAIVPDLYNIIVQAAKDGEIDPNLLKDAGIDAAVAGSEGFLIGSISSALTIACQSGMLGEGLSEVSAEMLPNVVSVLVVVSIDAIRYGYSLSKGEITTDDYGNLMAEEVFTCAAGTATGALFQYYMPYLPCAYMLGSFIGSMLATMGYEFVEDIVLEIKDAGGFEAILPAGVINSIDAAKESLSDIGIGEWVSNAKDVVVSTTKEGYITVSSAVKDKINK